MYGNFVAKITESRWQFSYKNIKSKAWRDAMDYFYCEVTDTLDSHEQFS
jgi:hypothetical protein